MSLASARTEQIYVSRTVRNGLETLALMHTAAQPEGAEGPSISATADGLADAILREHLDAVPKLAERKRAIRKAIAEIDAQFAQQQP